MLNCSLYLSARLVQNRMINILAKLQIIVDFLAQQLKQSPRFEALCLENRCQYYMLLSKIEKYLPTARLELAIFGLEDRRLIHWATQAFLKFIFLVSKDVFCSFSLIFFCNKGNCRKNRVVFLYSLQPGQIIKEKK